jgi:hypothetical protein
MIMDSFLKAGIYTGQDKYKLLIFILRKSVKPLESCKAE